MLSERCISTVLGILNRRYLATGPARMERLPAPKPGHGYVLYAHVPFCERLCTYCSFNRFLYKESWARDYFADLREEMRMAARLGYDFASLYVGGGTPTILVDELCETIDLARELFPSIREVSAETSPNHLCPELVEALSHRVQRLSVGVQSFDDRLLMQMDRYGKYGSGEEVFERVASVAGRLRLLQRGHDLQLPEPDRGHPRSRHRAGEGDRREPDDVLPADGVAPAQTRTRRDRRGDRLRARGALLLADLRRARARVRARQRVDVLARPRHDGRRVHRRLPGVRGHRIRAPCPSSTAPSTATPSRSPSTIAGSPRASWAWSRRAADTAEERSCAIAS